MKLSEKSCKRIVVKIGSSLFYDSKKKLSFGLLESICADIASLRKENKEVVIVTSGAIALGMSVLKLTDRPKDLSTLQASAAIGQNELMDIYRNTFRRKGLKCGQVLLTWDDFSNRVRYLNARNTLSRLLALGVVPVINENDTVSIDEIKFGDNDQLSALVANTVDADLLIVLSDVDGLWGKDKKTIIRQVSDINADITGLAATTKRCTSVGGMITKLKAAGITIDAGIPCVIANGRAKSIISGLASDPYSNGTIFLPKGSGLNHRQRWLAHSTKPSGSIVVDDGAKNALKNKKSLLSVGIVSCKGSFKAGDIISICDKESIEIGRGQTNMNSQDIIEVKGKRSPREVIHCDNIVIF
ncbi:MAG: glutamate 5-kinase [Candidatus Omnitrophica bacterium]|nr:glutamate 5-kinase [Candidatus Omnitrophota bacterium]